MNFKSLQGTEQESTLKALALNGYGTIHTFEAGSKIQLESPLERPIGSIKRTFKMGKGIWLLVTTSRDIHDQHLKSTQLECVSASSMFADFLDLMTGITNTWGGI